MNSIFHSPNLDRLRSAEDPLPLDTTFFASETAPRTLLSIGVSEDILVGVTRVNQSLSVSGTIPS